MNIANNGKQVTIQKEQAFNRSTKKSLIGKSKQHLNTYAWKQITNYETTTIETIRFYKYT